MRSFFETLGDLFEWTFQILPVIGPVVNNSFMIIGAGFFIYWMSQLVKHEKAGEH